MSLTNVSDIKLRLGINADGRVQRAFTNTCYKRMNKYVPKRKGNLRKIVSVQKDKIIYKSPYAHAQYVGYTTGPVNPDNYTTPGTCAYWDKKMVTAEMNEIEREMKNLIGRGY